MKFYNSLIVALTILFSNGVNAVVVTHNFIDDIVTYYADEKKKILVLCDLDNTLVETIDSLGSDQWFSGAVAYVKSQKKISELEAVYKVRPLYFKIHETAVLKPVEETTVQTVNDIKKRCLVLGLTARSIPLAQQTITALSGIGITFSLPTLFFQKRFSVDEACLKDGILFCSSNNKGEVLLDALKFLDVCPDRIIFIDDKRSNVEKLDTIFQQRTDIEFIGVHYTYLQSKVNSFVLDEQSKRMIDVL